MGYKRKMNYLLKFEDDEFEGLEVEVKGMSVKTALRVSTLLSEVDDEFNKELEESVQLLCDHLVSWNLENEDDEILPITLETLYEQDMPFVKELLSAWLEVAVGTSEELGKESNSGETSLEGQIPMETL